LKNPSEVRIDLPGGAHTTALHYGAGGQQVGVTLLLGHGAGAGQRSAFMVDFARALSALGLDVVTFNFLYTEQRRRIPDRGPALEACYGAVIEVVRRRVESASRQLFIGGKSMGGRIATELAAKAPLPIRGLVLLGYPLHPPGQPGKRRDSHLPAIHRPMLFVQGGRDAFGLPAELRPVLDPLEPAATLEVVPDGYHSFKLSRRDPSAQAAVYAQVQGTIVRWIASTIDL
jgi:predicted alpha/beta-hydrolase family hydrolase